MPSTLIPDQGRRAFSTGALIGGSPPDPNDLERNAAKNTPSPPFWFPFGLRSPREVETGGTSNSHSSTLSSLELPQPYLTWLQNIQGTDYKHLAPCWPCWPCVTWPCWTWPCSPRLPYWLHLPYVPCSPELRLRAHIDRLEQKARDPVSVKAINYDIPKAYINRLFFKGILPRFVLFYFWCLIVALYWPSLSQKLGLEDPSSLSAICCHRCTELEELIRKENAQPKAQPGKGYTRCGEFGGDGLIRFADIMATFGFVWSLGNGYVLVKATRERMMRLSARCNAVAWSFLKSLNPIPPMLDGMYSSTRTRSAEDNRFSMYEDPWAFEAYRRELRHDLKRAMPQHDIYQCMLLCVAFPVAVVQYCRGNTCDPAITRYCYEAASRLKILRSGGGSLDPEPGTGDSRTHSSSTGSSSSSRQGTNLVPMQESCSSSSAKPSCDSRPRKPKVSSGKGSRSSRVSQLSSESSSSTQASTSSSSMHHSSQSLSLESPPPGDRPKKIDKRTDHFFERFCCQLEIDYLQQSLTGMRTQTVPHTLLHIMHNIRGCYENYLNSGYLDRSSGFRECIEGMYNTGKEMILTMPVDMRPRLLLGVIHVSCWIWVVALPITHYHLLLPSAALDSPSEPRVHTLKSHVSLAILALLCALCLTLIREAWDMWDPFNGDCINTFAWTLRNAQELDCMINDFDEATKYKVRPHSYMPDLVK